MRVEIAFDELKIKENGFSKLKIFENIKENFSRYNLPCTADDEVLIFKSTGDENDYANIWNLIFYYIQSDWFLNVASKCNFYEFDDNEIYENVLEVIQLPKVKKILSNI